MEQELGRLYNKLADKIISTIPVEWSKIYYLGEVEKGKASWSSIFYFQENQGENIVRSHDIPERYNVSKKIYWNLLDEIDKVLLELYACFANNKQELWEQVTLELDSTGKFNINYLYDTLTNSEYGQVGRETIWAYETFGLMPQEGSYCRGILDKYIAKKK